MKTLLIVDDSKTFQKLLEVILSPYFKIVGKGSSGIEGFELYSKLKPDLVLMDITMPNCNGKDCLKNIINYDPQAKVIMVSSLGDESTVNECLSIGALNFVRKNNVTVADNEDSRLVKIALQAVQAEEDKRAS